MFFGMCNNTGIGSGTEYGCAIDLLCTLFSLLHMGPVRTENGIQVHRVVITDLCT